MPQILLLVGEDHRRATHAISRAGWLTIAQQLVNPDNPKSVKVIRALEESPNSAQKLDPQGYHKTIGLERETISSGAYKKILSGIISSNTFPPNETMLGLKEAILSTLNISKYSVSILTDIENTFQGAQKIINEMDIRDLQTFFGREGKEILEEWFAALNETQKNDLLMQFCEDQLLNLSYPQIEINKLLGTWSSMSLYGQLFFITASATDGPANIRHLENQSWVETIQRVTIDTDIEPDIVIAFVGNEHLSSIEAIEIIDSQETSVTRPGLIELSEMTGLFERVYVASNITGDMPTIPEDLLDSDSSEENSISWPSDSEKEEPSKYEDYFIEQTLDKLRNTNPMILLDQDM